MFYKLIIVIKWWFFERNVVLISGSWINVGAALLVAALKTAVNYCFLCLQTEIMCVTCSNKMER